MILPIPKIKKKKPTKPQVDKRVIAIDFDGVTHDYKNPIKGRRMGEPIKGTQEALVSLKDKGYRIVIHSVWADSNGSKTIADFMKYYNLPFDEITNIKPHAEYYIDDRAIKFTSWEDVLKQI